MEKKLQETTGNISTKDLMYMIYKILIPNCPINRDDPKAANDIFWTSIKDQKGKTVRKSIWHIWLEIERIPAEVLYRYNNVTMTADIMFVNNIIFLLRSPVTYSLGPQKSLLEIKIKWQIIQIWKNNDKRTIRVQVRNIDSSRII